MSSVVVIETANGSEIVLTPSPSLAVGRWTAVHSISGGSSIPDALAFDAGLYIGAWPPEPPTFMPSDAGEVDFYIGPISGSGALQDFSVTGATDVYRYRGGGTEITGSITPSFIAGSHLIVAWWDLAFTVPSTAMSIPSVEPEELIPIDYVETP